MWWLAAAGCLVLNLDTKRTQADEAIVCERLNDAWWTGQSLLSKRNAGLHDNNVSAAPTSRTVVDVMVLHTSLAKEAHSEAGVRSRVALALAYLNEACNRSGVHARFRLVYQGEVTWHNEEPRAVDELYWLAGDGEVADLRDQFGADLVALLVRDGQPNGGMALMPGNYSVFNGNPAIFAHELGHNLDCDHERANASYSPDSEARNFGYSFIPPDCRDLYGTIMSYTGSQIQQFSNPEKYFLGAPTGQPAGHVDLLGCPDAADNAGILNQTTAYAAQYRTARIPTLESPWLSADGREFRFRLLGPELAVYAIEHSADLRTWSFLTYGAASEAGTEVIDAPGTSGRRFYRASQGADPVSTQIGWVTRSVPVGYSLLANPLEAEDNTIAALWPSLPEGVQVFKWIEGRQLWACNSFSLGRWSDPGMTLHPGEGIVFKNNGTEPLVLSFVGEVNQSFYNRVPLQLSIRSSAIPQGGPITALLQCTPFGEGGQIFRMTGADGRYTVYTREQDGWSPEEPVLEVGEAFWCRNPVNAFMWQRCMDSGRD